VHPPAPGGLLGGEAGACGVDKVNGKVIPAKTIGTLNRGDVVTFETPGGGGMYPASERDPQALARDVADGLVTPEAAENRYR